MSRHDIVDVWPYLLWKYNIIQITKQDPTPLVLGSDQHVTSHWLDIRVHLRACAGLICNHGQGIKRRDNEELSPFHRGCTLEWRFVGTYIVDIVILQNDSLFWWYSNISTRVIQGEKIEDFFSHWESHWESE